MSLISTPFYELTCNGRIDNLRRPECPAIGPIAGFDQEEVVKRALDIGWTESGRGHKCPGCSFAVAVELPAPTRKPRAQKPPVEVEQFDGQNQ
jgi:hypothetical protein